MSPKISEKHIKKLIKKFKVKNCNLEKQIERERKVNLYERMTLRKELTRLRSVVVQLQVNTKNVGQSELEDMTNVQHTDSTFWEKLNNIETGIDSIHLKSIQYETSGLDTSSIEKVISGQPSQVYGILPTVKDSKDNVEESSDNDTNPILEDNITQNDIENDSVIGKKEKEVIESIEDGSKETKCTECGNDTSWESFIAMHRGAYKTGLRITPCFTCNMSFLQSGHFDGKHRLKRPPKEISKIKRCICETCGAQFTSRSGLQQHYAVHGAAQYSCDVCGYKCRRKTYLKKHISTHNKPVAMEDKANPDILSHSNLIQPQFRCSICSHICNTKSALNLHNKSHTNDTLSPINKENNARSSNDKKCTICSYSCSSLSRLKSHLKSHYGIKPFSCEFCSYRATTKYNLSIHRKLHLDDKPYRCDVCKYSCVTAAKLNVHMKRHRQ